MRQRQIALSFLGDGTAIASAVADLRAAKRHPSPYQARTQTLFHSREVSPGLEEPIPLFVALDRSDRSKFLEISTLTPR